MSDAQLLPRLAFVFTLQTLAQPHSRSPSQQRPPPQQSQLAPRRRLLLVVAKPPPRQRQQSSRVAPLAKSRPPPVLAKPSLALTFASSVVAKSSLALTFAPPVVATRVLASSEQPVRHSCGCSTFLSSRKQHWTATACVQLVRFNSSCKDVLFATRSSLQGQIAKEIVFLWHGHKRSYRLSPSTT